MSWNLSQGGMQLEVEGLKIGETAQLAFVLPQPRVTIEATFVVTWVKSERQGIYFTQMKVEDQIIVRDFITQVETSPPR
jgi:hypothetical protein